jgi:hypothetical protein
LSFIDNPQPLTRCDYMLEASSLATPPKAEGVFGLPKFTANHLVLFCLWRAICFIEEKRKKGTKRLSMTLLRVFYETNGTA